MRTVRMAGMITGILFLMVISGQASAAWAADGEAGGAAAYLKMGVGARALGMGGAFIGVSDDATAAYWNPAGLAGIESRQLSTMHADLTLDRSYNFINMVGPASGCNWGFSWIRAGVDSIQGYDALGNPTTVFEDKEDCLMATAAKRLDNGIDIGLSLKYLKHELYNNSADGYGIDLGVLYDASDRLRLGLVAKELGAELEWDTASGHADDVPYKLAVGCSYKIWDGATLALDISQVEDGDTRVFVGGESYFRDKYAVRAGMADEDFTAGAGIRFGGWEIDYAFQEQELGDIHRVSALFKFDTVSTASSEQSSGASVNVTRQSVPAAVPAAKPSGTEAEPADDSLLTGAEKALARKEFTRAAGMYETVLKDNPDHPDIRYKLGMAYMMAGETEKARVAFTEALKREPNSKYARYAELLAR